MQDQDWKRLSAELCKQGYARIAAFLTGNELVKIRAAVGDAFVAAPYGRDERTNDPNPPTRPVGLGEEVDILPIFCMGNDEIKAIPSHLYLKAVLDELLGSDFYLDRAIVRRARGKCPRFYYHKDQHGGIGLTILGTVR